MYHQKLNQLIEKYDLTKYDQLIKQSPKQKTSKTELDRYENPESVNNFVYFWKSFSVWNAYLNKHGIQGILVSSESTVCSFFELVIVF